MLLRARSSTPMGFIISFRSLPSFCSVFSWLNDKRSIACSAEVIRCDSGVGKPRLWIYLMNVSFWCNFSTTSGSNCTASNLLFPLLFISLLANLTTSLSSTAPTTLEQPTHKSTFSSVITLSRESMYGSELSLSGESRGKNHSMEREYRPGHINWTISMSAPIIR